MTEKILRSFCATDYQFTMKVISVNDSEFYISYKNDSIYYYELLSATDFQSAIARVVRKFIIRLKELAQHFTSGCMSIPKLISDLCHKKHMIGFKVFFVGREIYGRYIYGQYEYWKKISNNDQSIFIRNESDEMIEKNWETHFDWIRTN